MRIVLSLLIVVSLSTPARAGGLLSFVAHSLHQTNYRQTLHFPEHSRFITGAKHVVALDPQDHVIEEYHAFWHQAIDVAPAFIGQKATNIALCGFIAIKAFAVAANNAVESHDYWLLHHEIHF